LIFFGAANLTVTAFINDRKEGFWNRTLLANVSMYEMLICHSIVNSILSLAQIASVVVLLKLYFADFVILGSELTVLILFVLVGWAGLYCGLMMSCFLETFVEAIRMLIGFYIVFSYLSGELISLAFNGVILNNLYFRYLLAVTRNPNFVSLLGLYYAICFAGVGFY